jgi:hypothetical protein
MERGAPSFYLYYYLVPLATTKLELAQLVGEAHDGLTGGLIGVEGWTIDGRVWRVWRKDKVENEKLSGRPGCFFEGRKRTGFTHGASAIHTPNPHARPRTHSLVEGGKEEQERGGRTQDPTTLSIPINPNPVLPSLVVVVVV